MSYEYRVITDKKPDIVDLNLIYNNLKKCSLFHNVVLSEYGISLPYEGETWSELVGIELIDEGFYVTVSMNQKEREALFSIVQNTMNENGIKIIIEEE